MTFFIRDENNNTIWEAEYWVASEGDRKFLEISSSMDITNYSHFLLANQDKAGEIVAIFNALDEIRGWMWEVEFMTEKNVGSDDQYERIRAKVEKQAMYVCELYGLNYVTD